MKLNLSLSLLLASASFVAGQDIVATAVSNGSFITLVAALEAAELVDTLSNPDGTFTVFAPTDTAFAALPDDLVRCLLMPYGKDALTSILTYHVLQQEVLSGALTTGMSAQTVQGSDLTFDVTMDPMVNNAKISPADLQTDNGVIHVIDSVLVPPGVDVTAFLGACPDIPATAVAAGSFETLVTALTSADLVEPLSQPNGPYTVFAPTDDAFGALDDALVPCLLKDENKDTLVSILQYHVINQEIMSTSLTSGMSPPTLNGASLDVDLSSMDVMVGGAKVTNPDILTRNGVIHVIDSVLVPPGVDVDAFLSSGSCRDIPQTAAAAGSFSTLLSAVNAAELAGALSAPGPLTVFAPTDDAFEALPAGLVDCLLEEENQDTLSSLLTYHVVEGKVESNGLVTGMTPRTLNGLTLTVDLTNGVKIDGVSVATADIEASNGVIHSVEAVLVPSNLNVTAFLEECEEEDETSAAVALQGFAPVLGALAMLVGAMLL